MNNTLFNPARFYPGMSQEPALKESALNLQFYKTISHFYFLSGLFRQEAKHTSLH